MSDRYGLDISRWTLNVWNCEAKEWDINGPIDILVKTPDAEVKQNVKREANCNVRALNTRFRSVGLHEQVQHWLKELHKVAALENTLHSCLLKTSVLYYKQFTLLMPHSSIEVPLIVILKGYKFKTHVND